MFIGMVSTSFLGSMAYNMVIAWSLYYFFSSFQKTLPWDGCDHDFNDNGMTFNGVCSRLVSSGPALFLAAVT